MKKAHWSLQFFNFITLEIPYDDGARQGWDYDTIQYDSLQNLKLNMAADFADPRMDRTTVSIQAHRADTSYSGDVDIPDDCIGMDFVDFVFEYLEQLN